MLKFAVIAVILGVSAAYKSNDYHSIELPVKSKHDLKVIHTPSHEEDHKTYVDIPGGVLPVYLTFKTQSSPVYVKQEHRGTKGSYQKSDSHDEPHKLVHEVIKPVYQELKEIITPYRKVIQVIEPVKEERLTKVHKGERKGGYGGDGDDGYGKSEDSYKGYGKSEDSYKMESYKKDSYEDDYKKDSYKGYGKEEDSYKQESYKKDSYDQDEGKKIYGMMEDMYKKYG